MTAAPDSLPRTGQVVARVGEEVILGRGKRATPAPALAKAGAGIHAVQTLQWDFDRAQGKRMAALTLDAPISLSSIWELRFGKELHPATSSRVWPGLKPPA